MSHQFKFGDRVRCINPPTGELHNVEGIVTEARCYTPHGPVVCVRFKTGHQEMLYEHRFERH